VTVTGTLMDAEDAKLVEALRRGEESAFAALMDRHSSAC
jgi:hypothetical protein